MAESRIISVILLTAVYLLSASSAEVIVIDATRNDGYTLQYYLCNATEQLRSDTTVELSVGTHIVEANPSCIIQGLSNLTIRGVTSGTSGEVPVLFCKSNLPGCGFVFYNVTDLRVENLMLNNFGTALPDDLPDSVNSTYNYFGVGQKVVLLFSHCINLRLENVLIDSSFGYGIAGVNLMGDTTLNQVVISNTNNYRHVDCAIVPNDFSCSGSGAVFVYADDPFTAALGENTTLTVANSWMVNNTNLIPLNIFLFEFQKIRLAFTTDRIPITGAGGIAVAVGQLGYHLDVLIVNSTTQSNIADTGSLVLQFYNSIRNSRIHIDTCILVDNIVRYLQRGAGLATAMVQHFDFLNSFPKYPDDVFEVITVTNSLFLRNYGSEVGAFYIYASPQNVSNFRIRFDKTKFIGNIGAAPVMEIQTFRSFLVTSDIHVLLSDVEAYRNTFPEALSIGSSTLQSSSVFFFRNIHNVTIVGTDDGDGSQFCDNSPGVFLAAGGNVFLKGRVRFENNIAVSGGAVSLYDSAVLYIHEESELEFVRNQALRFGGAIFVDSSLGTGVLFACAIQFIGPSTIFDVNDLYLLNINVSFTDNVAGVAGNSLFATPLYDCYILPESSFQSASVVQDSRAINSALYTLSSTVDNGIEEIVSSPTRICICNQTLFNQNCIESLSVSTVPGRTFIVHLVAVDDAVTRVASLLYAELNAIENSDIQLGPDQDVRQLSGVNCTPAEFTLYGKENSSAIINLFAIPGGLHVSLDITIDNCPPGFEIEYINEQQQCSCSDFITSDIDTTCNAASYTVARPDNSWMGVKQQGNETVIAYVITCPIDYCSEATEVNLTIPDQICDNGRTGVLCGQCSDGFSVIFGSAKCSTCTNFWLFSIPFFGLVGIALVLVLFLANLTVTAGTVHGLIFYANIVGVNTPILFRNTNRGFLFVFISLLNLELGFPLCFFDGMDDIAKVGLQFIFPSYLLLLSGAIIFLSRYYPRIQKATASSGVPVLATLFYLSYNKIVRTVIDIISFATLEMQTHSTIIWRFDGSIEYCTGLHIFLFIVAILVILFFIFPYTFSLVFIVPIQKYTRPRLKPLVDAYLGPYKDKWRYWFGLRLFALPLMSTVAAFRGTDDPGLALLLQLFIIVILTLLQTSVHPFKSFATEVVDESFLLNFIILALTFSYLIGRGPNQTDGQEIVVSIMISLAFVAFVSIIVYHAVMALRKVPMLRLKMNRMYSDVMTAKKQPKEEEIAIQSYPPKSTEIDTSTLTSDIDSSFCELREPLLDS